MSGLLYCREREVKNPYYARELGISLYSAEELGYYIDHYILLLTPDFMDEALYQFLGEELGYPELEGRVRKWMSVQNDMYQGLVMIEQELHYLSETEWNAFRQKIEGLKKAGPLELLKQKGDFYIDVHQYANAIRAYDQILKDKKAEMEMLGRVWNNRGLACIRLMQMQEAMDCFYHAWQILKSETIAHEMFILYCMESDIELPEEVCEAVPGETQYRWKEEFDTFSMDAVYQGKAKEIAEAFDKDVIRRKTALNKLLCEWKQEYREMAG